MPFAKLLRLKNKINLAEITEQYHFFTIFESVHLIFPSTSYCLIFPSESKIILFFGPSETFILFFLGARVFGRSSSGTSRILSEFTGDDDFFLSLECLFYAFSPFIAFF